MNFQHQDLVFGHWRDFNLIEQLANVGSEVERAIAWKKKNNQEYFKLAFYRALELLDLTIRDPKNKNRLKEVCRTRELLVDYFTGNNLYHQRENQWSRYFYQFAYLAQKRKGKREK